jgi:hypothetical protein
MNTTKATWLGALAFALNFFGQDAVHAQTSVTAELEPLHNEVVRWFESTNQSPSWSDVFARYNIAFRISGISFRNREGARPDYYVRCSAGSDEIRMYPPDHFLNPGPGFASMFRFRAARNQRTASCVLAENNLIFSDEALAEVQIDLWNEAYFRSLLIDFAQLIESAAEASTADPIFENVYLGAQIENIRQALDERYRHRLFSAATWYGIGYVPGAGANTTRSAHEQAQSIRAIAEAPAPILMDRASSRPYSDIITLEIVLTNP